ncbi:Uncharacterized protein HZ326_24429 [Fusarium oxysporum f. sp. albedinis]|nr:Uncharacterized protein HZ326_24429 [Fusarium oxysporum f. sp. albedinis]
MPPQPSMSMSSPGPPDWHPTLAIHGIGLQPLAFASTSPANADVKGASTPVDGEKPPKNKEKRNKPTLSCHECVERKTKVGHYYLLLGFSCCIVLTSHLDHPYSRFHTR